MRVRAVLLTFVALLVLAARASAATFTVSGSGDGSGGCRGAVCPTLRGALKEAGRVSGSDTIVLAAGAHRVSRGQLPVTSDVTITATGAATTAIVGDGRCARIFHVTDGARVTIAHVTIAGGVALARDDGVGGNVLADDGTFLTLDHVRLTHGVALRGGGLGVAGGARVTLSRSLLDDNVAVRAAGGPSGDGGGLISLGDGPPTGPALRISDTTIARNRAVAGSGLVMRGNAAAVAALDRVTIADNTARSASLGAGVAVPDGATVTIGSSIVAANVAGGSPRNCDANLTSRDGNLETGITCGFRAPADRPVTDPQLSTLLLAAGGETPVLTIAPTSPAVDLGPLCTEPDQRDLPRPQGTSCDAGAYEVDQPPEVAITGGPSGPTNDATPTFSFAAAPDASGFDCRVDQTPFAPCDSPYVTATLGDGPHTFEVRAHDAAGNVTPVPASRRFTVDTSAPATAITSGPSGSTSDVMPTFTFAPSEPAQTTECRLDGPNGPGTFETCTSPWTVRAPAPGDYTFVVRATDTAGNTTVSARTFRVVVPLHAAPAPTPSASPIQPTPTPVARKSVVLTPVSGTVLVRLPGTSRFQRLDVTEGVPLGSEVDVKAGRVRLASAPRAAAPPDRAEFYRGRFIVTQHAGVTDLALSEHLGGCGARARAAAGTKVRTRRLWGSGNGSFRTSGRYSSATIRGTRWLVRDTCTTTLTRVTQGVVAVRDISLRKTIIVRKGGRYTAGPRRRR
jgi:hypothetical protein